MSGQRTAPRVAPPSTIGKPQRTCVEAPDDVRAFVEGDEKRGDLLDGEAYAKWLQEGGNGPCPDSSG